MLNDWRNKPLSVVMDAFCVDAEKFGEYEILLASYDDGGHEGRAYVLAYKDGKYYEIHASHCSCYGLEYQWDPEECTYDQLQTLIEKRDKYLLREELTREVIKQTLDLHHDANHKPDSYGLVP